MTDKIGVWGQFGDGGIIADGQAVRTTIITKEMKERYGEDHVSVVNTNGWSHHPFSFLLDSIRLFRTCEKIVIFPADNGFKTIVPIYRFLSIFQKRKLYDVVIGGYLPDILRKHPFYLQSMKRYQALFVQTPNLKRELEALSLNNVRILSNLKRLNTRKPHELAVNRSKQVTFCTLSRITESKGIEDAMKSVELVNQRLGEPLARLDVFGIVGDEYRARFDELLQQYKGIVRYGGVLKYDETVETLKDYFALLFPSFYYGEGFPGAVVDALHSGVPIIATDWNYNCEVVVDGRNGILVEPHRPDMIADAIMELYFDREKAHQIALNNLVDAQKYTPENVLQEFFACIDP